MGRGGTNADGQNWGVLAVCWPGCVYLKPLAGEIGCQRAANFTDLMRRRHHCGGLGGQSAAEFRGVWGGEATHHHAMGASVGEGRCRHFLIYRPPPLRPSSKTR